jgi:hypothetical protein
VILVKKSFMIIWAPPRGNLKLHILKLQFQITRGPGYPLYFAEPHRDASLLVPASIPGAEERCSPAGAGFFFFPVGYKGRAPLGPLRIPIISLPNRGFTFVAAAIVNPFSHQQCDTYFWQKPPLPKVYFYEKIIFLNWLPLHQARCSPDGAEFISLLTSYKGRTPLGAFADSPYISAPEGLHLCSRSHRQSIFAPPVRHLIRGKFIRQNRYP